MASFLDSMAATLGTALSSTFHLASINRAVAGTITDPADPPAPTYTAHTCRALILEYSKQLIANGYAEADQRNVLILRTSLDIEPIVDDLITMSDGPFSGQSFVLLTINSDPAKATWDCKGRPG